jgi:phosphoglycolate phosphatase-like HAD superfamily hydrolase
LKSRRPWDVAIFDFDGTIADTMTFLVRLAVRVLTGHYGLEAGEAKKAYIDTTGLPFVRQVEVLFPGDARNSSAVKEFEDYKAAHVLDLDLFPDAPGVVAAIREAGIKVCISSGSRQPLIERFLVARGLTVDLVMGYRPDFEKGPQHFRFAAETFGSALNRVVFIGDSVRDGLFGRAAGVDFIGKSGLVPAEMLRRALPGVTVIELLPEVLPLLGI